MNIEKSLEFYDAYNFIDSHPAFIGDIYRGVSSLEVLVFKCCKNDQVEHSPVYIYKDSDRYEEFLGKGNVERFESEDKSGTPDCIWVHYEDYFNEEWEFDHIDVVLEGGAHYYDINAVSPWNWQRLLDRKITSSATTYQEAIISFAKKVKERYGDYDYNNVCPRWIYDHNKDNPSFDIENLSSMFEDGRLVRDPNYIPITEQEENALWWNSVGDSLGLVRGEIVDITKFLSKENYEKGTER